MNEALKEFGGIDCELSSTYPSYVDFGDFCLHCGDEHILASRKEDGSPFDIKTTSYYEYVVSSDPISDINAYLTKTSPKAKTRTKGEHMDRFEIIYRENTPMGKMQIKILADKETGVNYLFASDDHGAGITPLLDKEGKIMTTK